MTSIAPSTARPNQDRVNQTQTQTTPQTQPPAQSHPQAILRLRGAHSSNRRSVQWREDVVDNEGLGRKKSKVCCIYHRPTDVDESSDESSSDSSSSSSSDNDSSGPSDDDPKRKKKHSRDCHSHGREYEEGPPRGAPRGSKGRKQRRPSPNAYEKMPKTKKTEDEGGRGGVADPSPTKGT